MPRNTTNEPETTTKTPDALARIRSQFADMKDGAERSLARFRDELGSDPIRAMRWADRAVADAARLDLAAGYLRWIDQSGPNTSEAPTAEIVAEDLRGALIRGGRNTERSTSPSANVFERERLSALADVYENVERILRTAKEMAQ
jgi:hypothetical protein